MGRTQLEADDRAAIVDCLHRYARGVDRCDDELVLSAFHPDAMDYHGEAFHGTPHEFVDWMHSYLATTITHQIFLMNSVFDFDGNTAHVETYFMATEPMRSSNGPALINIAGGRYVDRFEKRDGEWRIALRVVVTDSLSQAKALPIGPLDDIGTNDRSDISYARPLEGPRQIEGAGK